MALSWGRGRGVLAGLEHKTSVFEHSFCVFTLSPLGFDGSLTGMEANLHAACAHCCELSSLFL